MTPRRLPFRPSGGDRSRHPVVLIPRHDHPDDARHLVFQGDGRDHARLASDKLSEPVVCRTPLRMIQRIRLMAPTISSLRMSAWPILLIPPSRVFLPVDRCLGARPRQAVKFLPLEKVRRSGANATNRPLSALCNRAVDFRCIRPNRCSCSTARRY